MGCGASQNELSAAENKYAHPSYADGYDDDAASQLVQDDNGQHRKGSPRSSSVDARSKRSDGGVSSSDSYRHSPQVTASGIAAGESASSLSAVLMTLPECAYCPMCIQRAKMLPPDQQTQLRASERWWCNGESADVDGNALVAAVRFVVASNPSSITGQLTTEQCRVMKKILENHSDPCAEGLSHHGTAYSRGGESTLTAFDRGLSALSDTGSMSGSLRTSDSNLQAVKLGDSPSSPATRPHQQQQQRVFADRDPLSPQSPSRATPMGRGYNDDRRFDMSLVSCSSLGDMVPDIAGTTPGEGHTPLFVPEPGGSSGSGGGGGDASVLDAGPGEKKSPSNGGRRPSISGSGFVPPLAFGDNRNSSNNNLSPRYSPRQSPTINVPPPTQYQQKEAVTPRGGNAISSHVSEGSSSTIGGERENGSSSSSSSSSDGGSSQTTVSGGAGEALRKVAIGLGYAQRIVGKNVVWVAPNGSAAANSFIGGRTGGPVDVRLSSPLGYDVQAYDEQLSLEEQIARLRPRHDSVGNVSAELTGLSSVLRRKLRERDAIKRVESEGPGAMDREVQRHVELCHKDLARPAPAGDKYPGNGNRKLRRSVWKWMNKQPHHAPCVGCELEHRRCYQILAHDGSILADYERLRRLLERANSKSALKQQSASEVALQIDRKQQLERSATVVVAAAPPLSLCASCSGTFSRVLHTCN